MAVGKDDRRVRMDFAILKPRHAVVHAAGDFADFRMQRTAKRDVHFLQAPTDAKQRHAAGDAGLRQRQSDIVARVVIGLMPWIGLGAEAGRMDVGARAGQHDAIDHVQQRADVGNVRRAGKHQRQRTRDVGHRTKIALADHLGLEPVFNAVRIADHADHRSSHRAAFMLTTIALS